MLRPESSAYVLLVEGADEYDMIDHLRKHSARRGSAPIPEFMVRIKGGFESLLKAVETEAKVPGRKVLGILVDANDDPGKRWTDVTERLRNAQIEAPGTPVASGAIIEGVPDKGAPRTGIWMMPDNRSRGELEDFIAQMIPGGDAVWPLSQSYVSRIPDDERKFRGKVRKAEVHAWLAVRKNPRRMGLAIKKGDLDVNADVSRRFTDWLRNLFGA